MLLENIAEKGENTVEKTALENIVWKGENAGYQHFLLFPQCFQQPSWPGLLKTHKALNKPSKEVGPTLLQQKHKVTWYHNGGYNFFLWYPHLCTPAPFDYKLLFLNENFHFPFFKPLPDDKF